MYEKYTIEETLKTLEIKYDDITQVTDGGYGYLFLLTSNLENLDEEKLRSIGFTKMFGDLWYKNGENLYDIPKSRLIEIIENICGNNSNVRKNIFREENLNLWQSIVSNYCCILKNKLDKFKITVHDIETVCKYKDFLCINESQLKDFLCSLDEFIKQIWMSDETKNCVNLQKLQDIKLLRDYYVHDLEKDKKYGIEKISKAMGIIKSIVKKPIPNGQYDFWCIQNRILKDCDNIFKNIVNFLNGGQND